MNKILLLIGFATICASLPAPILERGGRPPENRTFTQEQMLQQTGSAKPMGEVGEVPLNTNGSATATGEVEDGAGNISSASSSLVTREGETSALQTANGDLQALASYRWWKTPLYASIIGAFAFAAVMGFRAWTNKKINEARPKYGAGKRR